VEAAAAADAAEGKAKAELAVEADAAAAEAAEAAEAAVVAKAAAVAAAVEAAGGGTQRRAAHAHLGASPLGHDLVGWGDHAGGGPAEQMVQ
jgi:hypothetical protein